MDRGTDRLDEYVRLAARLDQEQTAALVDPVAKQVLFEEIIRMHPNTSPQLARRPRRRDLRLVAVAAGVVAIAVASFVWTGMLGSRDVPPSAGTTEPTQATDRQGDVFGPMVGSCVEAYSPQAVGGRAFAFDGTVTSIGAGGSDSYVPVTFVVNEWFRGGTAAQVTIEMFPPDTTSSAGNAPYAVGSRLLVSGEPRFGGGPLDDPIAWACGFTRWYTEVDAQAWEQAVQ